MAAAIEADVRRAESGFLGAASPGRGLIQMQAGQVLARPVAWLHCFLKGQRRSARRHVLDDVVSGDDPGSEDQVRLSYPAGLGACAARPELATIGQELTHDILERREALLLDFVGVAIRRQPHSLDRQQDYRLLVGRGRHIAQDERERGAFHVLFAMCRVHQNFRHAGFPFHFLRMKNRERPGSEIIARSSLPVSRLQAGMPSWAAASSLITSKTWPLCSSRIRPRISGVRSPQPAWPRSTVTSATGGWVSARVISCTSLGTL